MGFCCQILSLNDLTPSPINQPGTHCLQWQRANARANLWWQHEPFPDETSIALRPCAGKAGVAIAILHQPRPTDSADINTWLQLSDTSSIPPMHGGFLLGTMQYAIIFHNDGLLYHNTTRSNINISHMVFWYVIILQFTLKACHHSILHHVFM